MIPFVFQRRDEAKVGTGRLRVRRGQRLAGPNMTRAAGNKMDGGWWRFYRQVYQGEFCGLIALRQRYKRKAALAGGFRD